MKWNNWLASLSSPNNAEQVRPGDPTKDDMRPPKIARPMGRDRAKKQRSSSNSSNSSSTTCLLVLQKMQVDRTAYEERVEAASKDEVKGNASRVDRKLSIIEQQIKIQQEMLQIQKVEQERQFMAMDVEKMAPLHDYYITMQKQISAKTVTGESSKSPSNKM
jgi:hypothetical protein